MLEMGLNLNILQLFFWVYILKADMVCNDIRSLKACNCTKRENLTVFADFLLSISLVSELDKNDSNDTTPNSLIPLFSCEYTQAKNSMTFFGLKCFNQE